MANIKKLYLTESSLILPMPNKRDFPLEGSEVDVDNQFWFRRLQDKDLTDVMPDWLIEKNKEDAKKAQAAASDSAAQPAASQESAASATSTSQSSKAKQSS